MSARHIQVPSTRTTSSYWTVWTSSSRVFSVNCTRRRSSAQWKETTSVLRWRRSERTRSYCQCSVASPLNSSNSSSMHLTNVDNNMSATSSLADQVRCVTYRLLCTVAYTQELRRVLVDPPHVMSRPPHVAGRSAPKITGRSAP